MRSLRDGNSVIIDRTNVSPAQRSTWLNLAQEYQRQPSLPLGQSDASPTLNAQVEVDAILFETDREECRRRLLARTEHETLHSPDQALRCA